MTALAAWGAPFGSAGAADALPPLPPLTDPATGLGLTGKIVWADLFVDDVGRARDFYTALFGWTWRPVSDSEPAYGLLLRDGQPVAGIVHIDPDQSAAPYGRWVHYVSTADVAAVTAATEDRGGRVLLSPRTYPERGEFAILADPEGAIFGAMDAAAGDPGDFRVETGEWLWHVLYSRNINSAASFYEQRFGYELFEYAWEPDRPRLVFASQGYARASVSPMPPEREDAHAAWVGFVYATDVPGAVERARALGAEVLFEPSPDTHDNGIAVIADPLGAVIGLLRWVFDDEGAQP
jgi:hypothetical protein